MSDHREDHADRHQTGGPDELGGEIPANAATATYATTAGGAPPTGAAGGVLDGTYPNPGLAAAVAGAGLAETSDVLSVNVDGSTIEINSDALRVKDGGITLAKLIVAVQNALVPLGCPIPTTLTTAPTNWLLCYGQTLTGANVSHPDLFAVIDPAFKSGNNIVLPDLRGRVVAFLDNMGGSDAGRLDWANTMGTVGGAQTHTLTEGESALKAHTHTGPSHTHNIYNFNWVANSSANLLVPESTQALGTPTSAAGTGNTGSANGSATAHNNMQPTILLNGMMRVL